MFCQVKTLWGTIIYSSVFPWVGGVHVQKKWSYGTVLCTYISPSDQESDLLRATLALSHSSTVAVTTGNPTLPQYEVKEGTDGLPGALALAQALLNLGKTVSLIVDCSNATLFNLVADYAASIGGSSIGGSVGPRVEVVLLESVRERWERGEVCDCLVAIGRVGRNKSGVYLSRDGVDISEFVDPIDSLFDEALVDRLVTTVAVASSGNEIGGGVRGDEGGCEGVSVVRGDCVVAAGVANWAGHALAAGLYAVSRCPLHWRYRKRGVDAETPPTLEINDFVNSERVGQVCVCVCVLCCVVCALLL